MTEQWQELKETIIEMRDNDGTGTQQEVCKFLANYMDVLEKQMSNQNKGEWKRTYLDHVAMGERPSILYCSVCCQCIAYPTNYCPNCGAKMKGGE